MNINIGNLEYAPFYEMNKNELLDYLKNDLERLIVNIYI